MDTQAGVRIAQSVSRTHARPAREFRDRVSQPDMALVIFFCSSEYDRVVLADEMSRCSRPSRSWAARPPERSDLPGAATTASPE